MLYSYKQGANVETPDYSAEQAVKGKFVPKNELKKEDLVFFDTMRKGRVSYVGLYIGEREFIQVATMIANYKKIADSNLDRLNQYKDGYKVLSWAKSLVEVTVEKGCMNGYSDNTIRQKDKITRA